MLERFLPWSGVHHRVGDLVVLPLDLMQMVLWLFRGGGGLLERRILGATDIGLQELFQTLFRLHRFQLQVFVLQNRPCIAEARKQTRMMPKFSMKRNLLAALVRYLQPPRSSFP